MSKHLRFVSLPVPCVSNFGTCNYDDLCDFLPNAHDPLTEPCPSDLIDLKMPCKCPINSNEYSIHNFNVYISKPDTELPLGGLYSVEVIFKNGTRDRIGCMKMQLQVKERSVMKGNL